MKRGIRLSHAVTGALALSIVCPTPEVRAAAALSTATVAANAQDTEVRMPPGKTRVAHDARPHRQKRAAPAANDPEDPFVDNLRRLPNFFPNCEHPAPRWCTHNY
jgi:hypothetical protein